MVAWIRLQQTDRAPHKHMSEHSGHMQECKKTDGGIRTPIRPSQLNAGQLLLGILLCAMQAPKRANAGKILSQPTDLVSPALESMPKDSTWPRTMEAFTHETRPEWH